MIDLSQVKHHPAIAELTDMLCNRTQNTDRGFFEVEVAYFLAKMASCQRALVITKDRGEIPVNLYVLALATSGYGKGHSVGVMEDQIMAGFRQRFMEETLPLLAEQNMWARANDRAARNGSEPQDEFDKLSTASKRYGSYPFTFDSGTTPAVKQLRDNLLLMGAGAINLQIDEIGSNLVGQTEVLTAFLELYDQGKIKMKLIKNTTDNLRGEDLEGKTPTNMLLFGTPIKLFDGGQTEDQFYSFLETGYARRCFFGVGQQSKKSFHTMDAAEIYRLQTLPKNNAVIQQWATQFHRLADPDMFGWRMEMNDDVAIQLTAYRIQCEQLAEQMAEHEEIKKAEMSHRYFKVLKLAGALAFVDESTEVTMDHLMSSILLAEESGVAFQSILTREKTYAKLAKYIAANNTELTHADLHEALPFYKTSSGARNEMMTLATAWGYKQHIIIKKNFVDGIEFFRGETLEKTNLDELTVSYSDHFAYNYDNVEIPFCDLHTMMTSPGIHWANHHFQKGHRSEENAVAGFNLVVIDVDGGISLDMVHDLMKEYMFMTYTTKRHSESENRFRLVMPINYVLNLDSDEYKEFMNSLMSWLPFTTDESANQRAKKWESFDGAYHYNKGNLLDALPFIPKTSKNEQFKKEHSKLDSMENLERWFAQRIAMGNRNNNMLKFALVLVDSGMDFASVNSSVHEFNKKLNNPLTEDEINSTIMVTVAKRYK